MSEIQTWDSNLRFSFGVFCVLRSQNVLRYCQKTSAVRLITREAELTCFFPPLVGCLDSRSCLEERAAAKTNADKEPNANIYIPACQPNGMWDKAQCHNVTRICWCVEQKTGMPIPGTTSSFEQEPNCTISDDRQMKGRIKGTFQFYFLLSHDDEMSHELLFFKRCFPLICFTNFLFSITIFFSYCLVITSLMCITQCSIFFFSSFFFIF